jgi:hypothetical protein
VDLGRLCVSNPHPAQLMQLDQRALDRPRVHDQAAPVRGTALGDEQGDAPDTEATAAKSRIVCLVTLEPIESAAWVAPPPLYWADGLDRRRKFSHARGVYAGQKGC